MPIFSLSVIEICVLMSGAILLGITIHFFIANRQTLKSDKQSTKKSSVTPPYQIDDWKLKFLNEADVRVKEIAELRKKLQNAEDSSEIFSIEAEELRKENKELKMTSVNNNAVEVLSSPIAQQVEVENDGYISQLLQTQAGLMEQNQKINDLLGNIDFIREKEEKQKQLATENNHLHNEVDQLKANLSQKEQDFNAIKDKASLSKEMLSRLDNAYSEFNALQDKIKKLEQQLGSSRKTSIEYEDLKEEYFKLRRDFEEQRIRFNAATTDNKNLQFQVTAFEDKLKESGFQNQQLQKRIVYLEDINNDIQVVTESNKRLEGQIKKIGELESMINMLTEENEQLVGKKNE